MKEWKGIIVHCSDSKWADADVIRDWHVNGNKWKDIGYNAVIPNGYLKNSKDYVESANGILQLGRGLDLDKHVDENEVGAHARGFNSDYIGICLVGKGIDDFTLPQIRTLLRFITLFEAINPDIEVKGHREMPNNGGKTCPNMDMDLFREVLKDYRYNDSFSTLYNKLRGN